MLCGHAGSKFGVLEQRWVLMVGEAAFRSTCPAQPEVVSLMSAHTSYHGPLCHMPLGFVLFEQSFPARA